MLGGAIRLPRARAAHYYARYTLCGSESKRFHHGNSSLHALIAIKARCYTPQNVYSTLTCRIALCDDASTCRV